MRWLERYLTERSPRLRHFAGVAADLGEARVEPVVVGGRCREVLNLASEHLGRRSRSTRWNVPLARQFIQVDPASVVARAPPIAPVLLPGGGLLVAVGADARVNDA